MRIFFTILILTCCVEYSYCQKYKTEIDSLTAATSNAKEDTVTVDMLNKLTKDLVYTNIYPDNYTRAINAINKALAISKNLNYKKGAAYAYNYWGIINAHNSNYQEALKDYESALEIRKETGDKRLVAYPYINIGNVFFELGNYPDALKNYLTAIKIGEEIKDSGLIANASNEVANVYMQQGKYNEALNNYFLSLRLWQNDKHGVLISNENIGDVYSKLHNYNEALKYFFNTLNLQKVCGDNDKLITSAVYDGIGDVYVQQGKYTDALKYYLLSLKLEEEKNYKLGIADTYINIGNVYFKQHKSQEARGFLIMGLDMAKENKIKEEQKEAYNLLSLLDSSLGNTNSSYRYFKLYSQMKDSILNEKSTGQIALLNVQYETEKKESEIALLNKNNEIKTINIEKQKAIVKYLISGFSLLIIFSLIAFWLYNQKRAVAFKHKILETEMKALRSQMNPHFTFNVLNSIQYYVGGNDMKMAEHYLNKFSTLIRMILDQSRNAYITLEEEINMLKIYIELEEMLYERKIHCVMDVKGNLNPGEILIPGMLIQPIVENAIKHGIEHKKGEAIIMVNFSSHDSTLLCTISDNGIGRKAAEKLKTGAKYKSVAINNILERMDALSEIYNIRLSYKMEDILNTEGEVAGTCVSMEIPIGIKNVELKM